MTSGGWVLEPTHLSTWLRGETSGGFYLSAHAYKRTGACFLSAVNAYALWSWREHLWMWWKCLLLMSDAQPVMYSTHPAAADFSLKWPQLLEKIWTVFMGRALMFNLPRVLDIICLQTLKCFSAFSLEMSWFTFSIYVTWCWVFYV